MKFHATSVTSSEHGAYYQILFESRKDTGAFERTYLIIQRQFEDWDGGVCYVETHDREYCGHFRFRRLDLQPSRLLLEIDRPESNVVEVTFEFGSSDFYGAARIVDIIAGRTDEFLTIGRPRGLP
jgi:hypothetical protein